MNYGYQFDRHVFDWYVHKALTEVGWYSYVKDYKK